MIRCTIELIPGGDEEHPGRQVLGEVKIANISNLPDLSDYRVELRKSRRYSNRVGNWKTGTVRNFPRETLGPYDLLFEALKACGLERRIAIFRGS